MNEIESIEAVFASDLTNVPEYGEMPDVCLPAPPADVGVAIAPRKLSWGAVDDADRANVTSWVLVDDIGGLFNLYAGIANNKIFFSVDAQPGSADEKLEADTSAINAPTDRWLNGEPELPFSVVGMAERDAFLKTSSGEWRRLDWTPFAIFSVREKWTTEISENRAFFEKYYTLYIIKDNSGIAFFTTADTYDTLFPGFYDGNVKPTSPRWPFSYYLKRLKSKSANPDFYEDKDDSFSDFSTWMGPLGRCCHLPWQADGEKLEDESSSLNGTLLGQYCSMPPVYICPRKNLFRGEVDLADMVSRESSLLYEKSGGDYDAYLDAKLTAEEMESFINAQDIPGLLNRKYSADPAFVEEQQRLRFGYKEGEFVGFSPTNNFVELFRKHIPETDSRWPVWLVFYGAETKTSLLAASLHWRYNSHDATRYSPYFNEDLGWGTILPPESDLPEDDDGGGDNGGGGGGGGGDNGGGEGDDGPITETLPDGYFFEAGAGVQIAREFMRYGCGWTFTVHVNPVSYSDSWILSLDVKVRTPNTPADYFVFGEDYTMYYGAGIDSPNVFVEMSGVSKTQGSQPGTSTEAEGKLQNVLDLSAAATFGDFTASSDVAPDSIGPLFNALFVKEFTKIGTIRKQTSEGWRNLRYKRKFRQYRLSIREDRLKALINNAIYQRVIKSIAVNIDTTKTAELSRTDGVVPAPSIHVSASRATVNATRKDYQKPFEVEVKANIGKAEIGVKLKDPSGYSDSISWSEKIGSGPQRITATFSENIVLIESQNISIQF